MPMSNNQTSLVHLADKTTGSDGLITFARFYVLFSGQVYMKTNSIIILILELINYIKNYYLYIIIIYIINYLYNK